MLQQRRTNALDEETEKISVSSKPTKNVAAKSYIAEGMEVSIRTIYLALTPIPC